MWKSESIWFEIAIVTFVFLLGNIFMGHFEERSPKWRKLVKYFVTVVIIVLISIYFGRAAALITFSIFFLPVIYVHGFLLPKKGINGWTGEPKSRYYEFRGWSKNIFDDENK